MKEKLLKTIGFAELTPIQKRVYQAIDDQRNLIGLAPTGTGKTHAYLLPTIERLTSNSQQLGLLILVPTNELVIQVSKMVAELNTNLVVKSYLGSKNMEDEIVWLTKFQPDIAILTPAKLFELARNKNVLKIHNVRYFVLDEADMMFDEQFLGLIDDTLHSMTINKFMLFSASITKAMLPFIKKYFGNYLLLDTSKEHQLHIKQMLLKPTLNRDEALKLITKHINPYLALVFVSKKEKAHQVFQYLKDFGLNVCLFSADLNVKQRKKLMIDIHDLKYQYVVASDLMARGIDFVASHVINYDLPYQLEYFIHRSGRTGRMNRSGDVITIQTPDDQSKIQKLKNMGIDFKLSTITKDGIVSINKKPKGALTESEMNRLKAVKKPTKVKPGYRKKHQQEVKKVIKAIKKERFKRAVGR